MANVDPVLLAKGILRASISIDYGSYESTLDDNLKYLIRKVYGDYSSYLTPGKLAKLTFFVNSILSGDVNGTFVEFGSALGGVSALLSSLKQFDTSFHIYDVFGMIPPPSLQDSAKEHARYDAIIRGKSLGIGPNQYYGYNDNLYQLVKDYVERFTGFSLADLSVELHRGDICNISKLAIGPVAFAHIDVDWYEPTLHSLYLIHDSMQREGVIMVDDYYTWNGAKKAVDNFLSDGRDDLYRLHDDEGSIALIRI